MDYSSLSKVLSCARQYEHSEIDRLAPSGARASAKFGDAWHQILYRFGAGGVPEELSTEEFAEHVLIGMDWADSLDYRNAAKLKRGFRRYVEHYATQPFRYIGRETSFKRAVRGVSEPWEGRIDAIVEWDAGQGKGKELWVVDYKTTSRLQSDWVEFYRNSNQFKGYFLSAQADWPELAGVVVDVYHATKGAKSGKSFEELEGNRFYRLPIRYEEFTLREAEADFVTGVTTAAMYRELGYYPKNTSNCYQYGSACPFLELCDAHSDESRARLKQTFEPNTFDPHAPMGV